MYHQLIRNKYFEIKNLGGIGMKQQKLWILVLLFSLFILSACTANTNVDDSTSNIANTSEDEIVIAFESDAETLLPNTAINNVNDIQIRNIYDPLINRDENGELIPALATDWKAIDENTWEFTLREGVTFHNGEAFNAEAVKFNIEYILDENNKSYYRTAYADLKEVKIIDDHKFQLITKQPNPEFIHRLADSLLIMEPTYVKDVGFEEAARNPIGTGPYKFVEWKRDQQLQLTAFDDYWQGKPGIKNVTYKFIPEFSSRLSAFLSGEVDVIKNVPVDSVDKVKGTPGKRIETINSSRVNFLALNNYYDGPLKDQRVRQAINYAIDVDELLNQILNGYGKKITGPLAEVNSAYTETKDYGYDPEKAIKLLEEAGYKPSDLTLQLDTPNGRYPMDTYVAQGIQSQLSKIGIKVEIQVNEWGNHLTRIQQKEVKDMFILGWGLGFVPRSTIESTLAKNGTYSGFYDEELEKMITHAINTFEEKESQQAWEDVQHRVAELAAWVPLWQQADVYGISESLNFHPRVDERLLVYDMSWNQ